MRERFARAIPKSLLGRAAVLAAAVSISVAVLLVAVLSTGNEKPDERAGRVGGPPSEAAAVIPPEGGDDGLQRLGEPVVVATGQLPTYGPFEIIGTPVAREGSHATCLTLAFLDGGSSGCYDAATFAQGFVSDGAGRYVVLGALPSGASSLRVRWDTGANDPRILQVNGDLAERIGADGRFAVWISELPERSRNPYAIALDENEHAIHAAFLATPTSGGSLARFQRCRKPPVALRTSGISCAAARRLWRAEIGPQEPGGIQRTRRFACITASLRPQSAPDGSAGLAVRCVRGDQEFSFHAF